MNAPSKSSQSHNHPFHLVDPSPWPAVGAVATFALAIGAILYMHQVTALGLIIGVILVVLTMILWWRDVVREARTKGVHSRAVRHGLRVGMALFITSEVMFFAAFFWAYFHNALKISPATDQWPPAGVETLDPWGLPLINTLILLSSGALLAWGRHGLNTGNPARLQIGIAASVVLGFTFLALQAVEYGHAAFAFTDGIYPSTFYMATGFHGFHVFVGAVFLTVCLTRARAGHFTAERHVGLEAAEWYWHFVDLVWVFLFTWFYWWGGPI